jgi:transcriptional regulator with XRE-family HTH domain
MAQAQKNLGNRTSTGTENGRRLAENGASVAVRDQTQPLHRLQEIRTQQDISVRSVSRRMNVTASEVQMQEDPNFDLRLSTLYRWQRALGVPAAELLVEAGDGLSAPVQLRARLLRMMKTIVTILDQPQSDRTANLIANLKTDILEVMPEVENVDRWHGSSSDRSGDIAAAVLRQIDDALLMDQ